MLVVWNASIGGDAAVPLTPIHHMRASAIEYVDADEISGITLNNTIRLSRFALLSSVCALSVVTHSSTLTPDDVRATFAMHEEIRHSTIEIHRCH